MSEALCGPSNPLANFRKHTAADRTLQQDRFSSHASPAESFRSSHGVQPGRLDAEFNAFASGHNPFANESFLPPNAQRGFHPFPQSAFAQPQPQPQATPDWAADFQRLQIGSRPSAQSKAFPLAAHRAQMASDEQQSRQMNAFHMSSHTQPEAQAYHGYQNANLPHIVDAQPIMEGWREPILAENNLQDYQMQLMLVEQQNQRRLLVARQEMERQPTGMASSQTNIPQHADAEAFEHEFAAYDEDLSLNRYNSALSEKLNSDSLVDDGSTAQDIQDRIAELYSGYRDERDVDMENTRPTLQMDVSDPREAEMTPQERQKRDDDLANTAGELLDRVSDNTSQKFQQSSFLALMRQLRDGEVKVDGGKMVDAETQVDVNEENQQPQSIFEHAREAGLIGPPSRYQTPQPSQQQRPMYGMAGALDSHPPTREEDDALLYREHKNFYMRNDPDIPAEQR